METKLDIYPKCRQQAYTQELKLLDQEAISPENKNLIKSYHNALFAGGSGESRVSKLSAQLRSICRWLKVGLNIERSLANLTRADLTALVGYINRMPEIKDATKADYRRSIKQFYTWYQQEDPRLYQGSGEERTEALRFYEHIHKNIKVAYKRPQIDPKTVLTDEDIEKVLANGCQTAREKAFISTLHETGCRAGEILNFRVGDIIFKDAYAEVHVPDSKTGKRTIFITKSVPHLLRYLDSHPYKDVANGFLWLCESNRTKGQPLVHGAGRKVITQVFARAGESKRHNYHWFRHSRASILAPSLTEALLCKYMGWTLGSKQVRNYVHLCAGQLEDAFLKLNHLSAPLDPEKKPAKCVCGALNKPNERYCAKCYRPMSQEVVIQDKEMVDSEINKTMRFFMEMAKNPELLSKFEAFQKTAG